MDETMEQVAHENNALTFACVFLIVAVVAVLIMRHRAHLAALNNKTPNAPTGETITADITT